MKRLAALLVLVLPACVSTEKKAELRATYQRTIPVCEGERDCRAKWEAAQLWVVHNADYKIQTVTNVLIETYNSINSSVNLAARVTKEPVGDGRYAIVITLWCANMFGCARNPWEEAVKFNRYINSIGSPPGPRIGVTVRNLASKRASEIGAGVTSGAVVIDVTPGSPAARSDIRVGDVIVSFNSHPVRTARDLQRAVREAGAGAPVVIGLIRADRRMTVKVVIDTQS